jgi:hypothetical protein
MVTARLLSRLVLLLFLGAAPARALEQWIYCAQNLWVDKTSLLETPCAAPRRQATRTSR